MKKRRLRELSVEDQLKVVNAYLTDLRPQQDIAEQFRITKSLISRLVKQYRTKPALFCRKEHSSQLR